MRLTDAIPPVLLDAARLLDQAAASYVAGSTGLDAVDLTGEDFEARFDAGVKELAQPWRAGGQSLQDARAAVAALGSSDTRVVDALARLDAASAFVTRGYNYVGSIMYQLPRPLSVEVAGIARARISNAGRMFDTSLRDAATAIRLLAAA